MKKIFLFLAFAALLAGATSCKKNCYCNAKSANGSTLDSYVYENLTSSECEAKVDEATQRAISTYGSSAMVGVTFTCSHL